MDNLPDMEVKSKSKILVYIKSSIWSITGTILGGIGGLIYFNYFACTSGSCMITSNPWLTTLWGAVVGYLLGSTIKSKNIAK